MRPLLMGGNAALGVRDERVPGAFFLDDKEGLIGFGGSRTVQAFPRAALIVVNGREQMIAGNIVEENRSGFAAALQAYIKFRGGLGEKTRVEVGSPEVEMAEPGVGQLLRFLKGIQRLAGVAFF